MILALNFLFVIPYFLYWKTMLLNSPNKEVSANSCSSGGDCDEQARISESAAESTSETHF